MIFLSRCGSVIVDLAVKFSSTVRESEVLFLLQDAVKNGKLRDFTVSSITGTRDTGITPTLATTPTSSSDSKLHSMSLTFCSVNLFCFSEALSELSGGHVVIFWILLLTSFYNSASMSHI